MLDFEQMAGRGGRNGTSQCLVLLLAEPWVFERSVDGGCLKERRTDDDIFNYVSSNDCRREFLSVLNADETDEGTHIFCSIINNKSYKLSFSS